MVKIKRRRKVKKVNKRDTLNGQIHKMSNFFTQEPENEHLVSGQKYNLGNI